jgi:hypothetical protein
LPYFPSISCQRDLTHPREGPIQWARSRAIVHGAGARTLELHARDGEAIARRLNALKKDKTWDRGWRFEIRLDPKGTLSQGWRDIAAGSHEHHLAINVSQARGGAAADQHHFLF